MAKRANGEGSIYKRRDGRWCAAVSMDHGVRKHIMGRTREEVARKLTTVLKAQHDGLPIIGERQTVAQFVKVWLDASRPSLRPRTWIRYEQYVRIHLIPELGSVPIARLKPQHLQRLYANRLASGLSPTSVNHLHAVLHVVLDQATRWGVVGRNVADLVDPPRGKRLEMKTFSSDEARRFLDAAESDRLEAVYVLALTTGMRQGELLALRWRDVDMDARTVRVCGTLQRTEDGLRVGETKTATSRRLVEVSAKAIDALRRHRTRQLAERLKVGPDWPDDDLVFVTEAGTPIEATNLIRRSFRRILERSGVRAIRFHDLRHTAATLLMSQGIHPKIVSEMLGHSQIGITLDLYSHVTPTMQRQAADALDALLS